MTVVGSFAGTAGPPQCLEPVLGLCLVIMAEFRLFLPAI